MQRCNAELEIIRVTKLNLPIQLRSFLLFLDAASVCLSLSFLSAVEEVIM